MDYYETDKKNNFKIVKVIFFQNNNNNLIVLNYTNQVGDEK